MAKKKDTVIITCYGQTKKYDRDEALKEFREAMFACEGHEQQRYIYIYECLKFGETNIDDSFI